jgi:indolepyruvate ferredoxin oxidoreductase
VFQPGVNEELAATALWGTQQLGFAPPARNKFDGVFGIWYGKGPGVDRCGDVFKHANMAGTTPWGGVIAVAGDDHVAKSSTAGPPERPHLQGLRPAGVLPATVQEILDHGHPRLRDEPLLGVWAGMKTIQEIVESSATALIDPDRGAGRIPRIPDAARRRHIRWPDTALEQEARLFDYKWYAALAYIRANRLNYNVIEGPHDRFGIIASGKALQRHAPGPAGPRPGRRHLPATRHPPAQGGRGVAARRRRSPASLPRACARSWWSRKSARSSNTS